jgi:hypothetical protein
MDLKNKIKDLFFEKLNPNSVGKKKILKSRGRKKIQKHKRKRKNNYKTQNARKILSVKHGVGQALKKKDNKFILDYSEIAKLMRKYKYSFNIEQGKWLKKKDAEVGQEKPQVVSKTPDEISPENAPVASETPKEVEKEITNIEDVSSNLKSNAPESVKNDEESNSVEKESYKSLQARLIAFLLTNKEWKESIQVVDKDPLEFYLPKQQIYDFLTEKQITWIESRNVWIDIDGIYPVDDRQGITGRALLSNLHFLNFLDVDGPTNEEVFSKLQELGYNWNDGLWKKSLNESRIKIGLL